MLKFVVSLFWWLSAFLRFRNSLGLEIVALRQQISVHKRKNHRLVFLKNHREVIAAMDFFTVPTATFRVLYCFFVISHSRRKVLHFMDGRACHRCRSGIAAGVVNGKLYVFGGEQPRLFGEVES